MADEETREDDEWLYGESSTNDEKPHGEHSEAVGTNGDDQGSRELEGPNDLRDLEPKEFSESAEKDNEDDEKKDESEEDDEESEEEEDDDDDGVQVVINTGQSFSSTKRQPAPAEKNKGKFSVEDFEGTGNINGVPAPDFALDGLEEKPWRKPGADITDYFNYGFTEETWKAYCDKQKRLRFESGVGSNIGGSNMNQRNNERGLIPVAISNDNSKYSGSANIVFPKKFGQLNKKDDMQNIRRQEPKENAIQVMTADRREYSRKAFDMPPHFDMSVPPPSFPPHGPPPPDPFMRPPPDFYNQPPPFYPNPNEGYEPQGWMEPAWGMDMRGPPPPQPPPSSIVSIPKAPNMPPPPGEADELGPPDKIPKMENN